MGKSGRGSRNQLFNSAGLVSLVHDLKQTNRRLPPGEQGIGFANGAQTDHCVAVSKTLLELPMEVCGMDFAEVEIQQDTAWVDTADADNPTGHPQRIVFLY